MAIDTPLSLRSQVIYSVFVRNHTPEGTFRALIPDLPRIRALGTDIVWLLPIHPIGEKARKGTLGSPYANRDYRAVNPEYGTREDCDYRAFDIRVSGTGTSFSVRFPDGTEGEVCLRGTQMTLRYWGRPRERPARR